MNLWISEEMKKALNESSLQGILPEATQNWKASTET